MWILHGRIFHISDLELFFRSCIYSLRMEKLLILVFIIETIQILRIKEVTGYRQVIFPITYLGFPRYIGRQKISIYSYMMNKIVKKIAGWHGKLLYVGGRNILIRHILQSLLIHLLAAVEPPIIVFKEIEKHLARFFWGSDRDKAKYHWSSWSNM